MLEHGVTPAEGISLGPVGTVAVLLILAWVLVGEPIVGRISHRRFLDTVRAGDASARERMYYRWSAMSWALALVVLAVAVAVPGFGLERLGLRLPDMSGLDDLGTFGSLAKGAMIGGVVGIVMWTLIPNLLIRQGKESKATTAFMNEGVLSILPRTPAERRGFAVLASTGGSTEGTVWRGLVIAALVALLPPLPLVGYVIVSAVVFGWAHLYQGVAGIFTTAAMGLIFAFLYLATSSLLVPIVLHALMDLRAILIPVPSDAAAEVTAEVG